MALFRVLYLREDLSRRFRELGPASVKKQLKRKDYEQVAELEAANVYAAWRALQDGGDPAPALPRPFSVGDVLERDGEKPQLCTFGGFEEASWWTPPPPEPQPAAEGTVPPVTAEPGL